jgi:hypothetical protein
MQWIIQILAHTPWWVFVLFAFLISRGIRALEPAEVSLVQLALVPALLTGWGLYDLARRYNFDVAALAPWLLALALGAALGVAILGRSALSADRARGTVRRPADFTVLPLILVAFAAKYTLAVMAALSPALLADTAYRLTDLGISGLFAGIFLGKFGRYVSVYLAASTPQPRQL